MISIPVSFLLTAAFSGLAVFALTRKTLPPAARFCFALLLGFMGLEAGLVGVRFAFGYLEFVWLQRVLPVWIAPFAFLAFSALSEEAETIRSQGARHCLTAGLVSAIMVAPIPLGGFPDVVIAGSFAFYTIALFRLWRQGADVFGQVPTGLSGRLHRLLAVVIAVLVATIIVDVLIAVLFAHDRAETAAKAISYASLFLLMVAVCLAILFLKGENSGRKYVPDPESERSWAELVETAQIVLTETGLYKDPNLSLTRLARRVGVPDRDLSRAINQQVGVNVTRFINRLRLEEAARLLVETDASVTKIQDQSGFLTRSNFYKEFQKHFGMSPGHYRRGHSASSAQTSR